MNIFTSYSLKIYIRSKPNNGVSICLAKQSQTPRQFMNVAVNTTSELQPVVGEPELFLVQLVSSIWISIRTAVYFKLIQY